MWARGQGREHPRVAPGKQGDGIQLVRASASVPRLTSIVSASSSSLVAFTGLLFTSRRNRAYDLRTITDLELMRNSYIKLVSLLATLSAISLPSRLSTPMSGCLFRSSAQKSTYCFLALSSLSWASPRYFSKRTLVITFILAAPVESSASCSSLRR